MTPVTGATFSTAMRRSGPCLGAERQRRASILLSADAGRVRLVSRVSLRPRCRKSGSVLGWRAPDHRLTAVGLGPRGSGLLLKEVGRQPLASSPASERVQPALEGVDPDRDPGAPVGQSLYRDAETRMLIERGLFGRVPPNALAPPLGGLRASPSFGGMGSNSVARTAGDPSGRSLASARSRLAAGDPAPSEFSRSPAGDRRCPRRHWSGWRQGRRLNDRRPGLRARRRFGHFRVDRMPLRLCNQQSVVLDVPDLAWEARREVFPLGVRAVPSLTSQDCARWW